MVSYTVDVTDTENKAMSAYMLSQQAWIDNMVHDRANVAVNDVCKICVEKCLETGTPIPGTKDDMVNLAFQMGWVKTVAEQNAEREAEMQAQLAASQENPPTA